MIPRLPQVSASAQPDIDSLCVPPIRPSEQGCQRILALRDDDEMDVIRHQAIGDYPDSGPCLILQNQLQV